MKPIFVWDLFSSPISWIETQGSGSLFRRLVIGMPRDFALKVCNILFMIMPTDGLPRVGARSSADVYVRKLSGQHDYRQVSNISAP